MSKLPLSASTETARLLEERAQLWQSRLLLEAVPMLERWCSRAMASGELQVACILWLHLALIQRWRKGEANKNSVSTLLCSELFLNANLDTSGLGTRRQAEELGLLDTEIFELFHSTRSRVYRWLQKSSPDGTERDAVLEHVVSTVASSPAREVAMRRWWELEDSWDGRGRFAASPSAPLPAAEVDPDEDFARWLSASVASAPVEVNVNLGQLQFRQHSVTVVPREVLALPEFQEVFPQVDVNACLLWALVERAPSRERYRFAGLRYEFRLWKLPDEPVMEAFSRKFPEHATVAEEWLSNAIAAVPEMQPLWTRGKWLAPEEVQRRVCKSAKLALSFGADSAVEPEAFHYEAGGFHGEAAALRSGGLSEWPQRSRGALVQPEPLRSPCGAHTGGEYFGRRVT
ncbi:unnamed protein product [Effrenium voratum]|uniref:Uncharacterized protein n=1 Tax=Effrenium voratum TaxID=2562239 RepID=A0AA36MKY7_9DINO|nr:unnamed protein product [Effrenium voratum]